MKIKLIAIVYPSRINVKNILNLVRNKNHDLTKKYM